MALGACSSPYDFDSWSLPVTSATRLVGLRDLPPEARARHEIKLVEELVIGAGDAAEALFGRVPPRIVVAPDGRVAVLDAGNHRVLVFGSDGQHQVTFGRRGQGPAEFGQPAEMFLGGDGMLRVWDIPGRRLSRWTLEGELLDTVVLPRWGGLISPAGNDELVWRETRRTPEGTETYFVRVAGDGTSLLQYALADIKVDGHGHVYVFPYVPKGTPPGDPRPVDVYSAQGERLFVGTISGRNFTTASATYNGPMYEVAWQAADADAVYGLAENTATGDYEVVRLRLVEPF